MGETKTARRTALGALLDEISAIVESSSLQRLQPVVLELKEKLATNQVRLAILGQMKRGKSSLLNALLGENVLPTGVLPLTSVVTEIRHGSTPKAFIRYQSGRSEEIAVSEIAGYVTETGNPGNRKRVLALHLFHPCELLREGLVLVDTPGFGSTYVHNTAATFEYLAKVDAAVIVFSADPPMTEVEAKFIRDIQGNIPQLNFVLNKVDLLSEEELDAACGFLQNELANRLLVSEFHLFPLTTRTDPPAIANQAASKGLARFEEHLRQFARYRHDDTLFLSILRGARQVLDLASFAVSLNHGFSSLTVSEMKEKRTVIQNLLDDASRETAAIRALLRHEQVNLMEKVDADLSLHVKASTPYLEERLSNLQRANPRSSGRALGRLLETFFNDEITTIFCDWRVQEDARIAMMLDGVIGRYAAKAEAILNRLTAGLSALIDLPAVKLNVRCGLAMDGRVTYSIERIFFSLDSFLLMLPPFLQRKVVFRRAMRSVPGRLGVNSGRIRFDYLERFERTIQALQRSLTSQIEDAQEAVVNALETSKVDSGLCRRIKDAQAIVSAMN